MPRLNPRHIERTVHVPAPREDLFARLDDQARLAEHMSRPSLMMGGGRMTYDIDAGGGRQVGSHIRMGGRAFGLRLSLDEEVTERDPPRRKVWRTVGEPKLVVLAGYQMGFSIEPEDDGSRLTVWIDYEPGTRGLGLWAPSLGEMYARWCVDEMVEDAVEAFSKAAPCGADVRCPLR